MIRKPRRIIQDDNNYIKKKGKVTHVCKYCGNLYQEDISLEVNCEISSVTPCCQNGYEVTTPEIKKKCSCGRWATQVDNLMGLIVKEFIDKLYDVNYCCEGHAYLEDGITEYSIPVISVKGNIVQYIPAVYRNKLHIEYDFGSTLITVMTNENCCCSKCCSSIEEFEEKKNIILNMMNDLVNSLPKNPYPSGYGCMCKDLRDLIMPI